MTPTTVSPSTTGTDPHGGTDSTVTGGLCRRA